ncbi:MAG: L,D-transpeptidase family protein [Actinomycetota bacterium]
MLATVLITIALGITTPVQSPEAADAVVPNRAPVSIPARGVRWLSHDLAAVDGALVHVVADQPVVVGRTVVNPLEGAAPVGPGAESVVVARLQQRLKSLNLFRGEIDGVYGRETAASVVAFHKLLGLKRSDRWSIEDWSIATELDHGAILARNPVETDRVEVDIARQLLFVIRDSDVAAVVPVSTGNGATYWSKNGGPGGGFVKANTPRGDFTLFRHIPGWRINYMGGLYKPWYFTPYYAIHGSKKVPARPASHGCVRIPTWEADHLDDFLEIGLPVHIWEA